MEGHILKRTQGTGLTLSMPCLCIISAKAYRSCPVRPNTSDGDTVLSEEGPLLLPRLPNDDHGLRVGGADSQ